VVFGCAVCRITFTIQFDAFAPTLLRHPSWSNALSTPSTDSIVP
jgi:hypothetical protein